MKKVLFEIKHLLSIKENVVVAIDGMCASGKTTLANEIAKCFDCNVIHCDDFFLPIERRDEERISIPGGNIDCIRMKNEVINHLGKDLRYKRFDCKEQKYTENINLKHKKLTIIEGSYALHPYFGEYYDYSIFMKIDSYTQLERIEKRNGKDQLEIFKNKWIVLENKYFEAYDIKETVNLVIDTSE